jgi:hypothetical protein
MTEAVLKGSTTIRHFLTGQLDIYHADGGISNYKPDGTRVEFHSGSRTVEQYVSFFRSAAMGSSSASFCSLRVCFFVLVCPSDV